jgi:hypothetical protein
MDKDVSDVKLVNAGKEDEMVMSSLNFETVKILYGYGMGAIKYEIRNLRVYDYYDPLHALHLHA